MKKNSVKLKIYVFINSLIVTQSAQDSPITSRNLRLIGKGCGRSRSSNVIGTSTLTPTRKW